MKARSGKRFLSLFLALVMSLSCVGWTPAHASGLFYEEAWLEEPFFEEGFYGEAGSEEPVYSETLIEEPYFDAAAAVPVSFAGDPADALVTVWDVSGAVFEADEAGTYWLAPGDYFVDLSAPGYESLSAVPLTVGGEPLTLPFTLTPAEEEPEPETDGMTPAEEPVPEADALSEDGSAVSHDAELFTPFILAVNRGGDEITSWAALQAALSAGGDIVLTADVTPENPYWADALTVPSGVTAALNLNGHRVDRGYGNDTEPGWDGSVLIISGTLTVTDSDPEMRGAITGGFNDQYGGGVQIQGGTFNLLGGSITGNRAGKTGFFGTEGLGGGVYMQSGTFNMSGGAITGNKALGSKMGSSLGRGGGVYVNGGTFTMSGGTVSGNEAGQRGGGVYLASEYSGHSGSLVSGGATITGNAVGGADNNVYLEEGGVLSVADTLTGTVGVTMMTPGVFTSGLSGRGTKENFTSDDAGLVVSLTDGGEAQLGAEEYPLWVGGVQATSANKGDVLGDGTNVTYNPETQTLTFPENITLTGAYSNVVIYAKGQDLTIRAPKGLTLNNSDATYGIATGSKALTVETGGVLAITVKDYGIDAGSGGVTVTGNVNITVGQQGIMTDGPVTVTGDVTILSGGTYGIDARGKVELNGNIDIEANGFCIFTNGDIALDYGTCTLTSSSRYDIYGNNITLEGTSLTGVTQSIYDCVLALQKLTLVRGDFSFTGGRRAIQANGDIEIQSGVTRVYGKCTSTSDSVICAYNNGEIKLADSLRIVTPEDGYIDNTNYSKIVDKNGNNVTEVVIERLSTYSVTVTPGANMTLTSGAASQTVTAGGAMESVVYTADKGYYFPEDYTVDSVNGVAVTRDSFTQITVSGTPTWNAAITLTAPTAKEASVVTKAPEAKTLTYNGSAQELVTSGEATGGEMQYALGTATEATQPYTTSIPTETDAGTYTVYYKVAGDENHSDTEAATLAVTVAKAVMTGIAAEDVSVLHDGTAKTITVTGVPAGAVVSYKLSTDSDYAASQPEMKELGSYTVEYKVTLANYEDFTGSAAVTILPNTYTVSFDTNGGTGAPASQTKTQATDLTLSDTKPSRADSASGSFTVTLDPNGGSVSTSELTAARTTSYTFKHWNTMADGSGTAYAPGAVYSSDAEATLYAQWTPQETTAAVTLPTPTRMYYTFLGWSEDGTLTGAVRDSYTPTGDIALKAVWLLDKPAVTKHPANAFVNASSSAVFRVTASGADLSCQWQYLSGGRWLNVTSSGTCKGYNTAALTVPAKGHSGMQFRCVVSNKSGSATSDPAKLTVTTKPVITSQPANASVYANASAIFKVTASGADLHYQWQYLSGSKWVNVTSGGTCTGYSTAALTVPAKGHGGMQFRCVVSNSSGSATSNAAKLTVLAKPVITSQPTDASVDASASALFKVTASGTGLRFQWQYLSGGKWLNVTSSGTCTGYNTAALTVPAKGHGGTQFRCVVSNGSGSAASDPAKLTILAPIEILVQPKSISVKAFELAAFRVKVNGENVSYQWEISVNNGRTWYEILDDFYYFNSYKTDTLFVAAQPGANRTLYRCRITRGDTTIYSRPAMLIVEEE